MSAPTLPLPEPEHRCGTDLFYKIETMSAIQDAAYLAGRDSALQEQLVDAKQIIQQAVNEVRRPDGITDAKWEYVKAGVRLLVAQVNDTLSRCRIEGEEK